MRDHVKLAETVSASSPSSEPNVPVPGDGAPQSKRHPYQCLLRVSRALLLLTYAGGVALGSWIVYALTRQSATEMRDYAFAVAGIFVGLAVPLSLHDMNMHMAHYVSPLQAYVLRVLWIVPIYSLQSWIALVYKADAFFLVTARECYEAYAIFSFYQLMLGALGGKARLAKKLIATGKERAKCLPPCCCLRGWRMGSRFVHRCTVGVYQYVLIRVIVSIIAFIAEAKHVYHEGSADFKYFYPWASLFMNCSQLVALYCLAAFYMETHDWGKEMRPLSKFLVIKAIVFVSWWQSIAIMGFASMGMIPSTLNYSSSEVAMALNNFAICIEMFFYCIGFHYFFCYQDFYSEVQGKPAPFTILAMKDAELDAQDLPQGAAASPLPSSFIENPKPLGYGAAVSGMLPFDVVSDTADSLRTGFGMTHKWEKRKKARRAEMHAAADIAWESAGRPGNEDVLPGSPSATANEENASGAGGDVVPRAAPRPIPLLNVPRLPESVTSQRTKSSRMANLKGGGEDESVS